MKNYISRLLSVLAISGFLVLPASLFALTPYPSGDVVYPYNQNRNISTSGTINPQSFGQTHSYNVLLRGNGEAVVWATASITNGDSTPVSQLVFKTGNMNPRLFEAWQEMSGVYQYQYKKLTVQQSGKTATVTLAQPVSQNQTSALIINYRGFGAVKKGLFGKMKFDFQTLESNDRIRSARVVAETDVDLYIKGDKAKVSYVEQMPSSFGKVAGGMAMENALSSGLSNSSLSSSIGSYYSTNSITKNTTDLLSGDVFHVRGIYASSWFGMHWTGFAWFIFIVAAVIAAIVYGRKYWHKISPPKAPIAVKEAGQKTSAPSQGFEAFFQTLWGAVVMGAINAVVVTLLIILIPIIYKTFFDFMRHGNDVLSMGITVLLPLLSVLVCGAAIFGPAIYLGNKYGRAYGFVVFGSQLFFLIFVLFFMAYLTSSLDSRALQGSFMDPLF